MRIPCFIFFLLFLSGKLIHGQSHSPGEKFRALEAEISVSIYDAANSDKTFKVYRLGYDEIPKYIEFRGTLLQASRWKDIQGEKILIQSVSGHFDWYDYTEDSTDFMVQDKSELYAYLFEKKKGSKRFDLSWKMYDYNECFGVDWFTGFIPQATTITDVDKDGITEISMPYVLICRGGMDPGTMKIIMYEGKEKYALRGATKLMCKSEHPYGGENKPSENLKTKTDFSNFMQARWEAQVCENERFY